MSTENGAPASPFVDLSRHADVSAWLRRPLQSSVRDGAWRTRAGARRGGSLRESAGAPAPASAFDDVLPLNDFLKDLNREKRRSDRTKAPLSLALYKVDEDARRTVEFLEVLNDLTRETDILGHVGDDMIALLCPDTDATGIKAVLRKIDASAMGLAFRPITAVTHPDLLFDSLTEGTLTAGEKPSCAGIARLPPALVADRPGRDKHGYGLKRPIDIAGALLGILLTAPVMLITALVVALTSPGPVIFRQRRLGQGGRPFVFYKFRSMVVNGDDRIHRDFVADLIKGEERRGDDEAKSPSPPREIYKMKSDPRVTPIGRFIRKTSIDELPQLFNVLKGDMSLVGPRPPIPYEAARYQAWHLRRLLSAKPGLTGLWQVEGRSKVSFNEMVRMDLRYIRDCSLDMDIRILFKTVKVVARCEGAA